jgi:beta-lactamase regulating signal transducer with metallopeptidase domain
VARCVLDTMPSDELQMILRHERAHATRWDNLPRMLLTSMPDPLMFSAIGGAIARSWQESAEEAADDLASGRRSDDRRLLASAIVRVARMAAGRPAPDLPALTLIGDSIERRVRRLLEPLPPQPAPRAGYLGLAVCLIAAVACSASVPSLYWMHLATEWMVNTLA